MPRCEESELEAPSRLTEDLVLPLIRARVWRKWSLPTKPGPTHQYKVSNGFVLEKCDKRIQST